MSTHVEDKHKGDLYAEVGYYNFSKQFLSTML